MPQNNNFGFQKNKFSLYKEHFNNLMYLFNKETFVKCKGYCHTERTYGSLYRPEY